MHPTKLNRLFVAYHADGCVLARREQRRVLRSSTTRLFGLGCERVEVGDKRAFSWVEFKPAILRPGDTNEEAAYKRFPAGVCTCAGAP
jgi:hypothetical protein